MNKLGSTIYNKLILQAKTAEELGMTEMANTVMSSIGSCPKDNEQEEYNFNDLKNKVYSHLWKTAIEVIDYHNLQSADISKIDVSIQDLTSKVIAELEKTLYVYGELGPKESKIIGQK